MDTAGLMFRFGRNRDQEILESYQGVKSSLFDFERIALFFLSVDKSTAYQVVSDSTLQDLDFEELFAYLDRTCSAIGQQYLYATLRMIPKDSDRSLYLEKIIRYLNENPEVKQAVVVETSKLNQPGAYFLYRLIYKRHTKKPGWFWIVPVLSGLAVVALMTSFVFPVATMVLFPILITNILLHYWNKNNILAYANTIPQLLLLSQIANKMISWGVFLDDTKETQRANQVLSSITKKAIFFKWEAKMTSELGQAFEYLLDLIKGAFLLELMLFFRLMDAIEAARAEIDEVFVAVAKVDVALSIASLRRSLPYYVLPDVSSDKEVFHADGIYHPLISQPVANCINLSEGKSALISGSNMSGKTTFIRTVGVNVILAQTINTACANKLTLPRLKVHSAIRITDDLLDNTSYYYEEVKTIKEMIEDSQTEHQYLFLLDELFKGTNTVERIASGKAVLTCLKRKHNWVFASTHDLELMEYLSEHYHYFHFAESIKNDTLTFDYKLRDGRMANTNAIRILEMNGFPKEITEEARALAKQIISS